MHLRSRSARRLAAVLTVSAGLSLNTLAVSASASAAPAPVPTASSASPHRYCVISITPGTKRSPSKILGRSCSSQHQRGSLLPRGYREPDEYLIWTGYQFTNFSSPDGAMTFTGPHPCSMYLSYYIKDSRPVDRGDGNWGISSWKASSSCWATTLYYGTNFGGPKYQYAQGTYEAGQIGSPWNDHVWSVWTGYSR